MIGILDPPSCALSLSVAFALTPRFNDPSDKIVEWSEEPVVGEGEYSAQCTGGGKDDE